MSNKFNPTYKNAVISFKYDDTKVYKAYISPYSFGSFYQFIRFNSYCVFKKYNMQDEENLLSYCPLLKMLDKSIIKLKFIDQFNKLSKVIYEFNKNHIHIYGSNIVIRLSYTVDLNMDFNCRTYIPPKPIYDFIKLIN